MCPILYVRAAIHVCNDFANSDISGVNVDRQSKCGSVDQSACLFRHRIGEELLKVQELADHLIQAFSNTNGQDLGI